MQVVAYLAGAGVEVQAEPMALPAFSRLATLVGGAAPAASRDMATHQATCTSSFVAAAASITQMFNQCRHVIGNINTGRFSALEPLCTGESWHGVTRHRAGAGCPLPAGQAVLVPLPRSK
jgi:hypothetical protein